MRNRLKIVSIMLILLIVTGCYKDKGNYDYKELPTPVISNIQQQYNVFIGDKLLIKPTITYKNSNHVIADPKYSWIISSKVVSTERDLDIVISLPAGENNYASFVIKDEVTGVETIHKFKVQGESTFKEGWLILSEVNHLGELSYQRPDGVFYKDIYESMNNEELSAEPVRLREHWLPWSDQMGQVNVICKDGPNYSVELDGANFNKIIYNKQEFVNDKLPVNFAPINAWYVAQYDILFNADGKIYTRKVGAENYQDGTFISFPAYGDYELADWAIRGDMVMANDILTFDKKNKRYMLIANGEIAPFNTVKDKNKAFVVENMTKDLIAGGLQDYSSPYDYYVTILKDFVDGNYYMHRFYFSGWGTPKTFYSTSETLMPIDDLIIKSDSRFAVCLGRPYLFFTSGSELYRYNIDSNEPPLLVRDYGKKIQTIAIHYEGNIMGMIIGDGETDNDFITVDISLIGNGKTLSEQKGVCGKGVDILYKVGDQWVYYK